MLERLEGRLKEMQERRRRLIKYLYKKEGKLEEFEEGYQQSINKKNSIYLIHTQGDISLTIFTIAYTKNLEV